MTTEPTTVVTISRSFQIRIPEHIRQSLGLVPGQKLVCMAERGCLRLAPVRPMASMRGFLRGMDSRIEREADR